MSNGSSSRNDERERTAAIEFEPDRSLDATFDLLADQRRRYVLHCLKEYENPMPLADLADEVATRENDGPLTEIPAEEVKRVYVSLYHTHVPKLEAADVVQYDQDSDAVALSDGVEQLDQRSELLSSG